MVCVFNESYAITGSKQVISLFVSLNITRNLKSETSIKKNKFYVVDSFLQNNADFNVLVCFYVRFGD